MLYSARWKVPDRNSKPTYPADGYVTLRLTQTQIAAVQEAASLKLLPYESPADDADGVSSKTHDSPKTVDEAEVVPAN